MTRIIAEQDRSGHWTAWFADDPCHAYGGDTAATAVVRLLEASGGDSMAITADYSSSDQRHMEFVLGGDHCPDCCGSGLYVGLNAVEDCRRCCGSGRC